MSDDGREVLVVMTCKQGHEWAKVGTRNGNGGIAMGNISAPGAPDDPTCCPTCHESAWRMNFLTPVGEAKWRKRQSKTPRKRQAKLL